VIELLVKSAHGQGYLLMALKEEMKNHQLLVRSHRHQLMSKKGKGLSDALLFKATKLLLSVDSALVVYLLIIRL
jgi:hypothetical protein